MNLQTEQSKMVFIGVDGTIKPIDQDPVLKTMQELLGGYIQIVPGTYDNYVMYCNEDGKLNDLRPNFYATQLYRQRVTSTSDYIAGPALLVRKDLNE